MPSAVSKHQCMAAVYPDFVCLPSSLHVVNAIPRNVK